MISGVDIEVSIVQTFVDRRFVKFCGKKLSPVTCRSFGFGCFLSLQKWSKTSSNFREKRKRLRVVNALIVQS
jgi:hypothetical protein